MKLDYKNHYYLFPDNLYGKINVNMISLFFISFGIIYRIIQKTKYPKEKIYYLTNKIISCIHAFVICYGSYIYRMNEISYDEWNDKYIIITKMYLIYDISLIAFTNLNNYQSMLHHLIFYLGICNTKEKYSIYIAQSLYAEITNFNLYIGWFLLSINKEKNIIFKLNGFLLLILFFIARVINYIYVFYISFILYLNNYDFEIKILSFATFVLLMFQIYWFILLCKKTMNINKPKERKQIKTN